MSLTHEQLEELKKNPEKYKQFREKENRYKREYLARMKEQEPERYKQYVDRIKEYNKKNPDRINYANYVSRRRNPNKTRQMFREYMLNYRHENRDNINEWESFYSKYLRTPYETKLENQIKRMKKQIQNQKKEIEYHKQIKLKLRKKIKLLQG